jgi:acetyltransferase-like isoleucine patch superfamily enzyme
MIGMGANVIEELVIGKGAVVAAGAAVIEDVKDKTLVAGVPAIVKKVYED